MSHSQLFMPIKEQRRTKEFTDHLETLLKPQKCRKCTILASVCRLTVLHYRQARLSHLASLHNCQTIFGQKP